MSVLSLFEIAVPLHYNDGRTVPEGRHTAFETAIMAAAGGYTAMPSVDGAWRDNEGHIYYDRMRSYRIACNADVARHLLAVAGKVYSDQKAFFLSEIGRAWIVPANVGEQQTYRMTRTAGMLRTAE